MDADEDYFWQSVIQAATHLEAIDSALCEAATRAWGLYVAACREARTDPTDAKIKSAVSTYGTLLDRMCARLGVDPLGRVRARPKAEVDDSDPLNEFGLK